MATFIENDEDDENYDDENYDQLGGGSNYISVTYPDNSGIIKDFILPSTGTFGSMSGKYSTASSPIEAIEKVNMSLDKLRSIGHPIPIGCKAKRAIGPNKNGQYVVELECYSQGGKKSRKRRANRISRRRKSNRKRSNKRKSNKRK